MPHLILTGGCHTGLYFLRAIRPLYFPKKRLSDSDSRNEVTPGLAVLYIHQALQ